MVQTTKTEISGNSIVQQCMHKNTPRKKTRYRISLLDTAVYSEILSVETEPSLLWVVSLCRFWIPWSNRTLSSYVFRYIEAVAIIFLHWAELFNCWNLFNLVLVLPYTKHFWNHTLLLPLLHDTISAHLCWKQMQIKRVVNVLKWEGERKFSLKLHKIFTDLSNTT